MPNVKTTQERISNLKRIPVTVPDSLLQMIGNSKKVVYKGVNLQVPKLMDALSTLITKNLASKKNFYRIYSEVLKYKYGEFYNFYMDFLIDYGFIEISQEYLVGSHCRGYKLLDKTLNSPYKRRFVKYACLVNKYKELYSQKKLRELNYKYLSPEVKDHVIKCLNDVDLSYDIAKDYLNNIQSQLTKEQYHRNLIALDNLNNDFTYIIFDDYGRVHTNYTTLKSEIRDQFLLIDGEKTKTLDISNSQPLFLTTILSKNTEDLDLDEYRLFKHLVVTGNLYEYIYTNRNINAIKGDPFNNKSKIKEATFVVFFGKNQENNIFTRNQNKLFKYLFPNIFEFIVQYKLDNGGHNSLAVNLQRSESNFLFNNVCKEIIEKYPNIKLFTVHDSITVKESDFGKIKPIFDKHINKLHNTLQDD